MRTDRLLSLLLPLALAACVTTADGTGPNGANAGGSGSASLADSQTVLRRIVHIARDLKASTEFYRTALGMSVLAERDVTSPELARALGADPTARITEVELASTGGGSGQMGARFVLLQIADPKLGRITPPRGGKGALGETVLAIQVPDVAAVDARLKAAKTKVAVPLQTSSDGTVRLSVLDPDGTRVLVYSTPPARAGS